MESVQAIKQRFGIIGNDPKLNRAIEKALQVAPTDKSKVSEETNRNGVLSGLLSSTTVSVPSRSIIEIIPLIGPILSNLRC